MLLISHIIIACSSLFFSALALIRPSKIKLRVSYILIGLTLATGTDLVLTTHGNLTQACTTGLVYLGVVMALIIAARYRLAHRVIA
jgi:hypothetical protein